MEIPVSKPFISELEKNFVNQAMNANAVSGVYGEFIERFETEFADFCQTKYAISCSSGTAALHLMLAAAGVKNGDEILVSTLTNMASFFAVFYCGARPIAVDIDPETLTMDPVDLARKITSNTRAIMVVHLFGHPTDMDAINEIATLHNLMVFEDCAEAHGAIYKGNKVGSLSVAGGFSFFANKVLTTGEGGMVTTNDIKLANKVRNLKALSFGAINKFMHTDIGYNYRMTNLQAALGCGQMAVAEQLVERRREIANFYSKSLAKYDHKYLILPGEKIWAKSVYWMYHLILKDDLVQHRKSIMNELKKRGIETREGFIPYNLQEIFIERGWTKPDDCPRAKEIAYASFYLPTGPDISEAELNYVVNNFSSILDYYIN
jgi:perosamine synthetase